MDKRCSQRNCKKKLKTMRFGCPRCSGSFCLRHQLPEAHDCPVAVLPLKACGAIIPAKISFI